MIGKKIDYVVTYVDDSDPNWQKLFNERKSEFKLGDDEYKRRYGRNTLFKYVFRGLEKNMPWINDVYLVVQSYSQVPEWIDVKKVKIIKHDEFIPAEYLPTFNSNVIEDFLHMIKPLNELFIYGNDDTFILDKCYPSDFFDGNRPRNNIQVIKSENDYYSRKMIRTNRLIEKKLGIMEGSSSSYYTAYHVQQPYSKSEYAEIFEKFKDEIMASLSPFRGENSLSQHLFSMYYVKLTGGKYLNNEISNRCFNASISARKMYEYLDNPNCKLLCINNAGPVENALADVKLSRIFSEKSKYEL